jgi:hypothetical protein
MNKLSPNAIEQATLLEEALHDTFSNSRRDFLKKGSLVVLAAASLPVIGSSLSSCASDDTMTPDDSNKQDVEILTTAYVVERLAINTYNVAASTGLLTGAFLEVAASFINDHTGHAATFRSVITTDLKASEPAAVPDSENFTNTTRAGLLVTPSFGNLTSAAGIVKYALALELIAAKLYFDNATNADSSKRLKSAAALNIAPIEAEHAAVFRAALKLVLATDTDADNTNVGLAISPRSFISSEMPRP